MGRQLHSPRSDAKASLELGLKGLNMNKVIRISQNRVVRMVLLAMAVLAVPTLAHAQTGCTDSPENPTAILALVGSAGAFFMSARRRLKARRKQLPEGS
jgi:XrtJ-associated TM-motif-TM protein